MTFKVKKERCDQCLFSKNKIVSSERKRTLIKECRNEGIHFVCHKATIEGDETCCRGFYDTQTSNLMRISQRFGWVEFVD